MTSLLVRSLRAEETSRRPLWLMRQAGRMLPEYRALRERHSFLELSTEPELAARVTLMPVRRFPLDAAIVFADLMSPVTALGVDVAFAPGPLIAEPLDTEARIRALPSPDPERIAPEVIETLRIVCRELGGRVPVLGFAGGPWSIAAYLVQGESKREFPALRSMALSAPELLDELLGRLTELCGRYLVRQIEAGAAAVQIFETWSGLLSVADWERLVKPHLQRLLERVGDTGAPRILYLKDSAHLLPAAVDLPCEALSVDWRVDLPALRQRVGPHRALQGNLDPALLLDEPAAIRRAAAELLQRMPSRGHVVNVGHGVLPDTRLDSVEALIRVVHDEVEGHDLEQTEEVDHVR